MKQQKLTFNQICTSAEKDNSEKLMRKAHLANRLAKCSRGRNKRSAYRVKADALATLVHRMPARISVQEDFNLHDFVVVELKKNNARGLHFPIVRL